MKILKRLKYPKFFLLILTIILAYLLFEDKNFSSIRELILASGIFGLFITGILFDYGFTSAPAIAIFLLMAQSYNIFFATAIAGLGSVFGDIIIFKFISCSFSDEIRRLNHNRLIKNVECNLSPKLKHYLAIALAGFIIASPLPDEIGIPLLVTAYHKLSTKWFAFISFILHTIMLFIIFLIGNKI